MEQNRTNRSWAVFSVLYFTGIVMVICQFSVPPVMSQLVSELNIDLTMAGWLMSIFAVAGIVLALPAAAILQRLRAKTTGLAALGCAVLGTLLGILADGSTTMLLARLVQGIGLGLISVIAPAVIHMWFPMQKLGRPMGIWATWVPAGSMAAFVLAAPLTTAWGWRSMWWVCLALCLAALLLHMWIVGEPDTTTEQQAPSRLTASEFVGQVLLNRNSLLLATAFCAYNFAFIGLLTWEPAYLIEKAGLLPAKANFMVSLITLSAVVTCIVTGFVLPWISKPQRIITISMLLLGIVSIWCFRLTRPAQLVAGMIVVGMVTHITPPTVFTLAPAVAKADRFSGYSVAMVIIGQNIGMMLGPPAVGFMIQHNGWHAGAFPIVLALAMGLLASLFVTKSTRGTLCPNDH